MGYIKDLISSQLQQEREEDLARSDKYDLPNSSVSLTPLGEDKAKAMEIPSPYSEVAFSLMEHGASTMSELAKRTRFSYQKLLRVLNWLKEGKLVNVAQR